MSLFGSISKAVKSASKKASSAMSSHSKSSSSSSRSSSSSKSSSSSSSSSSSKKYKNPLDRTSGTYVDRDGVERYSRTHNRVDGVTGSRKSGGYGIYGGPSTPGGVGSGYASEKWNPSANNNKYDYSSDAGGRYSMDKDYAYLIENEKNPTLRNQYIVERQNKINAMKKAGTWNDSYDENKYTPDERLFDRNTNGYVGPNFSYKDGENPDEMYAIYQGYGGYGEDSYYNPYYNPYEEKYNQLSQQMSDYSSQMTKRIAEMQKAQELAQQRALERQLQQQKMYEQSMSDAVTLFQNTSKPAFDSQPIVNNNSNNYLKSNRDAINLSERNLIKNNSKNNGGQGAQIKDGRAISRYLAGDAFKTSKFNQQ